MQTKAGKLIATCAAATFGVTAGAMAADEKPVANPITVFTAAAGARQPDGVAQQLVERAQSQGQMRVIVGLRFKMRPADALGPAAAEAQAKALRAIQDGVAARVLGSPAAQQGDRFDFIPFMSMFVNAQQVLRLLSDPDVVSVEEDVPVPPSDAGTSLLLHAPALWSKGVKGTGQVVAVLDTGVAKTHPMLSGKVVSEACYSTTDAASQAHSVCPGGVASSTAPGSGVNCSTAWIGCDHGTHVAGIAAGNSATLTGIARGSNLIAIQVFSRFSNVNPNKVKSYSTDQVKGLGRVLNLRNLYKIAAVNMSLGGGKFAATCDGQGVALKQAITALRNAGIATTIASGNDGFTGFINSPACISTAIAIGNSTKTVGTVIKPDLVWTSSNHSSLVKLMAPGTSVNSAVPGNGYALKTGTSMAAPAAAGSLAVLRSAKPTATVDDMIAALTCSGKPIFQRHLPAQDPVPVAPTVPRIDLIGAYNFLLKPANVNRNWQFTGTAEANDWAPMRGAWAVQSGKYTQTPVISGWVTSGVPNCNTALTVTTSLKRIDPETNIHWNSGVVIKAKADYQGRTVSGYWLAYNKCRTNSSGDCTGNAADPPGQAVLWRIDGLNVDSGGASGASLLCAAGVPIAVGGSNTIKAVANGSSLTYYLNGKKVCAISDATYTSGAVMVAAAIASNSSGHSIAYDFVGVQTIGSNSPVAAATNDFVMDPAALVPVATPSNMNFMGSRSR